MSKVMVTESYLQDVADAIREKGGTDTYTPAEMGDAIRDLPSGGGSSWTLIHEEDLGELNITSTSATALKTIYFDPASDISRSDKIIFVTIRDRNGARNGYFYGSDNIVVNRYAAVGSTNTFTAIFHTTYAKNANGVWITTALTQSATTTCYGIYVYGIMPSGRLLIYSRYASATSQTIDGDFTLKVYTLNWPEGSPFLA